MTEFTGSGCVAALGTFDGVHIGHAHLIGETIRIARDMELPAAALTFDRHPLSLIRPDAVPRALTAPEDKARLLAGLGLDVLIVEPFTPEFAAMSPEAYLTALCRALKPRAIVVGENHTFGQGGRGNAALLKALADRLGYRAVIVKPVTLDGEAVSSSRIRRLLSEGNIAEAERLAGHPL